MALTGKRIRDPVRSHAGEGGLFAAWWRALPSSTKGFSPAEHEIASQIVVPPDLLERGGMADLVFCT
jgi:hypothetical protein